MAINLKIYSIEVLKSAFAIFFIQNELIETLTSSIKDKMFYVVRPVLAVICVFIDDKKIFLC